jgi:GAF domain-containing protein
MRNAAPEGISVACVPPAGQSSMLDGLSLFTSLSRAMCGEAGVCDVGSLVWMMVRQVVPCESMAVFVHDDVTDTMVAQYAVGAHADALRQSSHPMMHGPIGWTGVTRRAIVNAEAAAASKPDAQAGPAPFWVCTVPLVFEESLTAVIGLYASEPSPFTAQHAQMLELLTPRLAAAFAALETRHNAAGPVEGLPAKRRAADLQIVKGGTVALTQQA